MTDLRTSLQRLADSTDPLPVDDDLWGRARAAQRRGRVVLAAAVVALVVVLGGGVALWQSPDREARTATGEVPGGAIPRVIEDPGTLALDDVSAVRRASVAFVSAAGQPVVVDAVDGSYHALGLTGWDGGLLSLSPDGTRLAWTIDSDAEGRPRDGFELMDLTSGDVQLMSSGATGRITPEGFSWSPSSRWLTWFAGDSVSRTDLDPRGVPTTESSVGRQQVEWTAVDDAGVVTLYGDGPRRWRDGTVGRMRTAADAAFAPEHRRRNAAGITSPSGDVVALATDAPSGAAEFLDDKGYVERGLASDLYPDGAASVTPLGWAADSLLLAEVDGPPGSYVEGSHVVLMTSPDRPRSEWTYRIVLRDLPDVEQLSVAAALVPDLDGTSSQELTHDFGDTAGSNPLAFGGIEASVAIGLGVALAIAVLMGLRSLWRRARG